MCTICGGNNYQSVFAHQVSLLGMDRGRDYTNIYVQKVGKSWIQQSRAIPTTEIKCPNEDQPFGKEYKLVHNGTIANDKELGNDGSHVDSWVLQFLDFSSKEALRDSLMKVDGSYAIAVLKPNGHFYLACNYEPIYVRFDGDMFTFSSRRNFLEKNTSTQFAWKENFNIQKIPPYTVVDTEDWSMVTIPRYQSNKAAVIASAGLDSTSVAAYACHVHGKENVTLIHFNYGCKAEDSETKQIKKIAKALGCKVRILPLNMQYAKQASTLLRDDAEIVEGIKGSEKCYEWVPARNFIMMATTVGYAEANDIGHIYLGTNLEESGAYPDNAPHWIKEISDSLYAAVNQMKIEIHCPLEGCMKHDIVAFGMKYNAPLELTVSCYQPDKDGVACGTCGPDYMRQLAFLRNGLKDPVRYKQRIEDNPEYTKHLKNIGV